MNITKLPKGIVFFSFIEMAIGFATIAIVSSSVLRGLNTKPMNVLLFVYVTSILSFSLGIGLLRKSRQAYELLLFLVGVVVLSKLLTATGIIHLNGTLETAIPSSVKNIVSILYHSALWLYLRQERIRSFFAAT